MWFGFVGEDVIAGAVVGFVGSASVLVRCMLYVRHKCIGYHYVEGECRCLHRVGEQSSPA